MTLTFLNWQKYWNGVLPVYLLKVLSICHLDIAKLSASFSSLISLDVQWGLSSTSLEIYAIIRSTKRRCLFQLFSISGLHLFQCRNPCFLASSTFSKYSTFLNSGTLARHVGLHTILVVRTPYTKTPSAFGFLSTRAWYFSSALENITGVCTWC